MFPSCATVLLPCWNITNQEFRPGEYFPQIVYKSPRIQANDKNYFITRAIVCLIFKSVTNL